jgi:CRISPR-associated nuclease/helicase Cas3, C-terminal
MELREERFALFRDDQVLRSIYAHQRFLLHEAGFKRLKVHVPTAGGKTLGAVLFALQDTFADPAIPVRTILTYPTNLLSHDQFERSVVRALVEWVGTESPRIGAINPVERRFVPHSLPFEKSVNLGAPTYVFELPKRLGGRDLYVTVITGEGLQHLFSKENIVELGRRKGTYLLRVLEVLNQHDHVILCSPDLLGYVAQRCYSVTGNFYNNRWRDELEIKLANHNVVVDEYHFYDRYTYLNLMNTLERLESNRLLLLSATAISQYFPDAEILDPQKCSQDWSRCRDGEKVASYPIDIFLHQAEMEVQDVLPQDETIYFYHSAITAHETAEQLRNQQIRLTEWTGILKATNRDASLTVATSAAEVGLDLPFREVHTEFWGNTWEIPSLIQRIGRVGRSEKASRSRAHIWISGREPNLLFGLFEERAMVSKDEFGNLLLGAFGEQTFSPSDFVSFYLWDEERTRELRRFWQIPPRDKSRLRFHFRPPNSQAVFNWGGKRFVYDWIPIANRYEVERVKDVTELPFWREMEYSEWQVIGPRDQRTYLKRYEGKKDKKHRRWFWRDDSGL